MKRINNKWLTAAVLTGIILFSACEHRGDTKKTELPEAIFLGVDADGQARFVMDYYLWVERGIVYGQSRDVTLENGTALTFKDGVYEIKLQTTPNTTYHWRPYFKDKLGGVLYGRRKSFTTEADGI